MITKLTHSTVFVRDQDEALGFYTEKLGFVKRIDNTMSNGYRWLTVGPAAQPDLELALIRAEDDDQQARIGRQVGDHILFILQTDDIQKTYEELTARGVHFRSQPEKQFYGTDAIFEDLYGNRFDLVQPA